MVSVMYRYVVLCMVCWNVIEFGVRLVCSVVNIE